MMQKSKKKKGLHTSPTSAIILIEVLPKEHLHVLQTVKNDLEKISGVKDVCGIFGTWDLFAILEESSFEDLKSKVIDEIRAVPGVGKTETLVRFPI
ncbi:MAG: Lrp/AsnC ligand binding domain-containing protein [Promethearchaeota archaeon]